MRQGSPPLLFVTSGFPPEQLGGIEQHTTDVARALRRRGIGVGFYARGTRDDVAEYATYEDEHDGFPVTRVAFRWGRARSLQHLMHDPELGATFGRYLDARQPRVVHVHHLGGIGSSILEVLREREIPFVMTLHDFYMMCPRGQMYHAELYSCEGATAEHCTPCIVDTFPHLAPSKGGAAFADTLPADADLPTVAAFQDWLRELLALPDVLLTASAAVRDRFLGFGVPPERIRVEEYGQDLTPFEDLQRTPSDRLRVGFFGTFIPSKGAHVLLQAFARLPEGSASLVLAGNSAPFYQYEDYMGEIRSLIDRVPPENPVDLRGPYDHAELPGLLARTDVLVVPPLWNEAFGLTLREGMLAGCAVVSSATGGLTQAVREGQNGFTFPPGDVSALASALERFVSDPSLAARLGNAPSRVRPVADMAQSLLDLYAEIGAPLEGTP